MASNFLEQWRKSGRKINHSGFDLTQKKVYSQPFGLMTMPLFSETNPNEHFELNVDGFMRTETMNTAAFADGKLITSLFFVPYSQIWHNFNSFVTQKDDRHSSAYKGLQNVPVIHLWDLHLEILRMYTTKRIIECYCKSEEVGDYYYIDNPLFAREALSAYRDEFSFESDSALSVNPDEGDRFVLRWLSDLHGMPYVDNLIRAVQFYKYGSPFLYLSDFDAIYNGRISAYEIPTFVQMASALRDAYVSTLDAFFGVGKPGQEADTMFWHKYVNLFRPAAYQHIFYDYFRNKYFDEIPYFQQSGDSRKLVRYIDSFNFDDLECDSLENAIFDFHTDTIADYGVQSSEAGHNVPNWNYARFLCLFDMHYRQYKHDIYTSALNATQFGAVSSISFEGTPDITFDSAGNFLLGSNNGHLSKESVSYSDFVTGVDSQSFDVPDYTLGLFNSDSLFHSPIAASTFNSDYINHQNNEGTLSIQGIRDVHTSDAVSGFTSQSLLSKLKLPSLFDVLQLRRAELMQQWKQNALRAGNMVDDNFKVHYGIEPYYESDNNVMVLGSWEAPLECKPVVATASTGDATNGKVGDLAATGVASANAHTVRFKSADFGVIVGINYFLPDVFYSANGIDQNNTLMEPFDFYSEEFENIGFENLPFATQTIAGKSKMLDNIGFVPPYTRYKTAVDEVFGEFSSIGSFDGSMRAWTMQREDVPAYLVNGVMVRDKSAFYVDPRISDSLFGVAYNGNQNTDPISCYYQYTVKALRPMSVLGIPIFG